MPQLRILPSTLFLAAFIVSAAGCSVSYSSKSSSDSIASIASSPSSVSSSGDGIDKDKIPYRDDVANLTYSVYSTSMAPEDFPIALARTAQQFKITDWAQEKATYYGIGKGLKKAAVPKEKIGTLPLLQQVLGYNKNALKWIENGYKD
jgi:hypothetical protein